MSIEDRGSSIKVARVDYRVQRIEYRISRIEYVTSRIEFRVETINLLLTGTVKAKRALFTENKRELLSTDNYL